MKYTLQYIISPNKNLVCKILLEVERRKDIPMQITKKDIIG